MTIQLATQNTGKIYSQNAMLTHLCYLLHKQRKSGARVPSTWKKHVTWSFTEGNWAVRNLRQKQSVKQEADFYAAYKVKLNILHSQTYRVCFTPLTTSILGWQNTAYAKNPYQFWALCVYSPRRNIATNLSISNHLLFNCSKNPCVC